MLIFASLATNVVQFYPIIIPFSPVQAKRNSAEQSFYLHFCICFFLVQIYLKTISKVSIYQKLTSFCTKELLAFKAIRYNSSAINTLKMRCLCIELETVAAPPRMRQSAAHVSSKSGREILNAVYDVTDSRSEGSGMNCERK